MKKIAFYMPKYYPASDLFGAATLGFAGKAGCADDEVFEFLSQPHGIVLNGTYEEILSGIPEGTYKAAIVLCGNAGGENDFVEKLYQKLGCPIVGGGAAMDGIKGGLVSGGGQAGVMLIDDENYEISVEMKNIHEHVIGTCQVDFHDSRVIQSIDGQEPEVWLREKKTAVGFSENDFEHFTLSDKNGVNAHLSKDGELIRSGRDLEKEMIIRYVKPEEVYNAVFDFYNDDEDTIVFGCAGIKGITGELTELKSLGLYMFGEIGMVDGKAFFGNLMLSKIKLRRKG